MTRAPKIEIVVERDFSKFPGPRYAKQGPNSGEEFRNRVLIPALQKYEELVVVLDNTAGYGSSFLDESFGGLVRNTDFRSEDLLKRIHIISNDDPTNAEAVEFAIKVAKK